MMTHDPDDDPFARRLRAESPAELPARWRAEILAAARLAEPATARRQRGVDVLTAWLWPHPCAYAGLLALWLLILFLHLITPAPSHGSRSLAGIPGEADHALALSRERVALNTALILLHGQPEDRP